MTWQYNPYIWPLAISAIVAWSVAVYMWPRRASAPGGYPLFILLICAGFWSASYAMEFASADLQGKYFWKNIVYLGIAPVCPLWFLFALNYSGKMPRNRITYMLLSIEPILVQIAVWTNASHQSFWTQIELVHQGNTQAIVAKYGFLFWIHAAFAYVLLIASTIVLIQLLIRTDHLYKSQITAIISGLFIPWAGNVIYLAKLSPFANLDLAPLSFTLASCILVWGLFHSKLFEAIPIARDTLIANMPNVVLVTDLHNRLIFANPAAQNLFGENATRKLGQSISEILPKIWQTLEHLKENTHTEIELQIDDQVQHYELYFTLLHNRQKNLSGHLIVMQDIGKQKETEEHLAKLEKEAEQASRAKSIFLANMSHEMRTPLNAILGYAQITVDAKNLSENHKRSIAAIKRSGGHLLQLIDDILYLSKIDAGQTEIDLVGFDLHKLLQEIGKTFKLRCEQQNLHWHMEVSLDTKYVIGDANKLRQVLINLLDNAVKFTTQGEVTLRVKMREDDQVYFEVNDTGSGISQADRQTIFQPFQQEVQDKPEGGAGLGLSIVMRQVELMGGELSLNSNVGKGSQFSFSLILPPSQSPTVKLDTIDWSSIKKLAPEYTVQALIVDADEKSRKDLTEMLGQIGVTFETATNGQEALQHIHNQMPDIIFTDLRTPTLDGTELLKKIHQEYGKTATIVVAVTGSIFDHQRQGYLDMGFKNLIDKPARPEQIYACLLEYLNVEFIAEDIPETPTDIDVTKIVLPTDLYENLLKATDTHSITDLRTNIEALSNLGHSERYLGQQLKELSEKYDMAGISKILKTIETTR